MNSETKQCQKCKQDFVIESDDFEFYKKMKVPVPTWCPECRLQRRLNWVSPRSVYPRLIDGKPTISMYAPGKNYNVVEDYKWWGDAFDMMSYGQEYDFSKPFFEQFDGLLRRAPLPHLQRQYATFENSDYCNGASYLKNCYLVFGADDCENVMYGDGMVRVKDCLDVKFVYDSELSYENLMITKCYRCSFCQDVEGSNDLVFCQDCVGCNNCVGCFGLRNKAYHIFNKSYSKEDYQEKIKEFNLGSFSATEKLRQEADKFFLLQPHKFIHGRHNKDVLGDYLYNSKNTHDAFRVNQVENCRFVFGLDQFGGGTTNSYDFSWFGNNSELMYEAAWCGNGVSNIRFSAWNYNAMDLQYCYGCHNSQHLFGCVGIRSKSYCILNKQYTKEEYEALVPKIIEHMNVTVYADKKGRIYKYGEFFPAEISPFSYNETMAHEFIHRSRQQVESFGYSWYDRSERNLKPEISWKELPDHIDDVGDELAGKLILCKSFEEDHLEASEHNCTEVFKLTPKEIDFYRKLKIPLPRFCPNSRYYIRLGKLNPMKIWHRQCMCEKNHLHHAGRCANEFETSYAPDRPEIVYCEHCYQAEVA